jgi:hypothetical protein
LLHSPLFVLFLGAFVSLTLVAFISAVADRMKFQSDRLVDVTLRYGHGMADQGVNVQSEPTISHTSAEHVSLPDLIEDAAIKRHLTATIQSLYSIGGDIGRLGELVIKSLQDTKHPAAETIGLLAKPRRPEYSAGTLFSAAGRQPEIPLVELVGMINGTLADYEEVARFISSAIQLTPDVRQSSVYADWFQADQVLREQLATTKFMRGFKTLSLPGDWSVSPYSPKPRDA